MKVDVSLVLGRLKATVGEHSVVIEHDEDNAYVLIDDILVINLDLETGQILHCNLQEATYAVQAG